MLFTLLVALVGVLLTVLFVARRHAEAKAWDRELEAAFCVAERREMTARRVL